MGSLYPVCMYFIGSRDDLFLSIGEVCTPLVHYLIVGCCCVMEQPRACTQSCRPEILTRNCDSTLVAQSNP